MSDTSPLFDHVNRYLELGKSIMSPALYLGTGMQPYWMKAAVYEPIQPDSPTLSAEDMQKLVESCTTPEQRETLDKNSAVDFIFDSPSGKHHAYLYKQEIVRSRCAEGHKAMWHAKWGGLPSEEFLSTLDPLLKGLRGRMFETTETAEKPVGRLTEEWAKRLGLSTDVVVAGGAFDCHMGAVGAGVKPYSWVRIIGTSTCDIMVVEPEVIGEKLIPGICGQVDGSVIPGLIGLEAGQSAFGDIYAWLRRVLEFPLKAIVGDKLTPEELEKACDRILPALTAEAEKIPVGESGVIAVDWMNGRRTPDANQMLQGAIAGITLGTTAPMLYRALVEATAFGSKAIMERLRREGVRIDQCIGIGGIALKSPFVMQVMSDVLGVPISVCRSDQACALGASIFAAVAAGLYPTIEAAQQAMASGCAKEYKPDPTNHAKYQALYEEYLALGRYCESR